MKKFISLTLAIALSLALFVSCSSESTEVTEETGTPSTGEASETQALEGSLITAEPTTLSIFLDFDNKPFNSEWAVWQEIAKNTNIYLEGIIPQSNSSETEAFNLMLTSGELPDIIGYSQVADLEQLGRDGGLIPLNDLIAEHAPNIQAELDSNPVFAQAATALDGNIYQLPKVQELYSSEFYWIRQDWLDTLNLETPQTVDELYDVLTAFRNDDPNGNGEKDEIPYFARSGHSMPDELLYLWNTSTEFFIDDNGQIVFEPLEEDFVTGMTNAIKWYEEGLIDPEVFTRGASSRDVLLSSNVGGFTHDWPSTGDYNTMLADEIDGFKFVGMAPPANQNGDVVERTYRYPTTGWGISSQAEDPVTIIKYFDYFFTEEGDTLINWGIENETYVYGDDGEKEFTQAVMTSELSPLGYLRGYGIQYRVGMVQDADYEYAFMNEEAIKAAQLYEDNIDAWYPENMPPYQGGTLNLKYLPEDESEYLKIMSDIYPYVDEKFQSWLLGITDFEEEYDEFIAELNARGIQEAIEINQRAYDIFINGQ